MPGTAAQFFQSMADVVQRLRQQMFPERGRFAVLARFQVMANLRPRLAALDEAQPIRIRRGIRCGNDFDPVAIA